MTAGAGRKGGAVVDEVRVSRIGTQVVVRLSGDVGDGCADRLADAEDEVASMVINRVVVDLADVCTVEGAGMAFLATLHRRYGVRLLNTPADLRKRLTPPA